MNKEELTLLVELECKRIQKDIDDLQQENQQLKEMIDEQDGCNKRRLQIFSLKDKLCKELKNVKLLKQENQQLKEEKLKYGHLIAENYRLEHNERVLSERINKAIEYCECIYIPDNAVNIAFQKVVEILKGDSNESNN